MASAVVLRRDAPNVRERFYASKDPDAFARTRQAGLSDDKLRAVLSEDRTSFNDTERLVIELADAMTDTPASVSDDLYARLRKQFSEEQLMQLGAQIAFENYRARWNRIFNVESDNLYTPQPNKSQESRSA